jgi:hypothetical protein
MPAESVIVGGRKERTNMAIYHPLGAPAAHSLADCMRELKFGRPGEQQLVIDEAINFVVSRLGNDGPPFDPSIVDEVFDKGEDAPAEDS